ncbi:MAG: translation elongation factor 4 [Patescibacteria group bacterium]|jgi:GTP-binding protein LepA
MTLEKIRNFCIIAHIDHGKSTLADRFLEITHTVEKRKMKEQLLDQMDLERERGITIKLQPVKMDYKGYVLNLIDTPGHVDFTYEVSRSLACCEGAILVVDATQGIEAQTLANLYLALGQNLEIIPVLNKIDLPAADVPKVTREITNLLGCAKEDIIAVSAKTGENVPAILDAIIEKVPHPKKPEGAALRALIFDSVFDDYRGVITYVRVMEGIIKRGDKIMLMANGLTAEALEVGVFRPQLVKKDFLESGEIGYIVSGAREVEQCRVGDTVTQQTNPAKKALAGYKEVKPMVFAGIFCKEGSDFERLREAIGKLKLNDAALVYEPENSKALGFGFRCGFLGLLHLDIMQERLSREYGMDLIVTVPSVAYKVFKRNGQSEIVSSPMDMPDPSFIEHVEEPVMKIDIVSPSQYIGNIMALVQEKRGRPTDTAMEYLDQERVVLHYLVPLSQIVVDFYDKLKNVSSGYASLNYELAGYEPCKVRRMDILVAGEMVEALSTIVYEDEAMRAGRKIVESLKKALPRQMFEVRLQAALSGKVVASENIPAMRKDVTAKLYGGDVTRKRKLLEKQKKGKKKMKSLGKVDIPQEAFLAVLKR